MASRSASRGRNCGSTAAISETRRQVAAKFKAKRQALLDVLRDSLGLTGSKEGCGSGDCGACSVMVDGRLVCSCLVLAVETQGAKIETINAVPFLRLRERLLVEPNKAAMGFPTIPGLRPTAPEARFINPLLDYDFGPDFDANDVGGVPTHTPPKIKQVLKMLVPRVNADGNEIGGVPVVLLEAPLGTYLGWNITAGGFHKDQLCNYTGGMIPFARTRAERVANGDPRLSLEERYGSHAAYVKKIEAAGNQLVAARLLLKEDAERLVERANSADIRKRFGP